MRRTLTGKTPDRTASGTHLQSFMAGFRKKAQGTPPQEEQKVAGPLRGPTRKQKSTKSLVNCSRSGKSHNIDLTINSVKK